MLAAIVVHPALAAPAAPAAPARGKVVRVERQRVGLVPPQFCAVMDEPGKVLCIGEARPGEMLSFVDQATGEVLGEMKIETAAVSSRMATCPGKPTMLYDVTGTPSSSLATLTQRSKTAALRGLSLGRRTRALPDYQPPAALADQQLVVALDLEGDGKADVTMYEYTCNPDGTPTARGGNNTQCFDTYTLRGGTLIRTHQDIVELCF